MYQQQQAWEYKPKNSVIAWILLAVLLLGCAGLVAIASRPAAIVCGVASIGFTFWLYRLAQRVKLQIDAQGLTFQHRFSRQQLSWDEVCHYRYLSMSQQYYGGGGAAGAVVMLILAAKAAHDHRKHPNRTFNLGWLKIFPAKGGKPIVISSTLQNATDALEQCFAQLHPRLAQRSDFSPFSFAAQELRHQKKGSISFPEIEHISVSSQTIGVKIHGKRLMWASANLSKVNNGLILLEQLSSMGVMVKVAPEIFVPGPVLSLFQATASRHASMPQARIHLQR
jgi:hypothetical protein